MTIGHSPQAASPSRRRLGSLSAVILLSVGSAACAAMPPGAHSDLSQSQVQRITEVCHKVMGVQPGVTTFAACQASLSGSFVDRVRARKLIEARRACLAEGRVQGSAGLGECELSAERTLVKVDDPMPADALPGPASGSYYFASSKEIHRREQRACVQIGYEPIAPGFNQCVADLASALADADFPPG